MGRSIFGWSLPPGCSHKDIDEAFGGDLPPCCDECEVEDCNPNDCEKYQKALQQQEEEVT